MKSTPEKCNRFLIGSIALATLLAAAPTHLLASPQQDGSDSSSYSHSDDQHNNGPYRWKNVQIVAGGFVDGIIGDPSVPNLRYARTDIGGAYRWNQEDHRWIPLTDFVSAANWNLEGTESLAIDPSDFNRVYLAQGTYADSWNSNNGAIMISKDRGQHFKVVPLPIKLGANDAGRFAGERLAVDPNLGSVIYFGSRLNGLWKSTDRGNTWAQVANFPVTGSTGTSSDPGVGVIFEMFPRNGGTTFFGGASKTIYVGVSDPNVGLYVTNDGGNSWSAVANQPTGMYPNSSTWGPDGNLYICYGYSQYGNSVGPYAMTNGAIWKYTPPSGSNPSGTWTNITPPKPSYYNWGYGSVAVDPNNPKVIMVSTMDRYWPPPQDDIFRSTDGGNTWESIQTNSVRNISLSPWVTFGAKTAQAGNWINHVWIDPFDSNHVLYGDGQTIWRTHDISDADAVTTTPGTIVNGAATHWSIGAKGVEETSVLALISPPSGPAHLLSGVGDIGGFTHTDLDHSPKGGMMSNPIFGSTSGLDFAQNNPLFIARVGNSGSNQDGAYSTDGGLTWTPFATMPTGVKNGSGRVAVSADGSTIVWISSDGGAMAYYSLDRGTTWTVSSGSPVQPAYQSQINVFSDRINPKKFYIYNQNTGNLFVSTDGAQTFLPLPSLATYGKLNVSPAAEGDLWFSSSAGLSHSTNSGVSFTPLASVQSASTVGFGMAYPHAKYPTVFLFGQVDGVQGVFRSTDTGQTWVRVNDDQHQYASTYRVAGDPRVVGRVYLGTNGRGVLYGDPKRDDHHDGGDHQDNGGH